MAVVISFTGHRRSRCSDGYRETCRHECMLSVLFLCDRCGGAEASLPTDCPGERMTPEQQDLVQEGVLDYRRGEGWSCRLERTRT